MSKVEEEEMLICDKCKKAYWITKNFFDHISECEGNNDEVIGITWWKKEDYYKCKLPRKKSIDIGMKWVKRPETR